MKKTETQEQNKRNEVNEILYKGKFLYERHMYAEAVAFLKKAYADGCLEAACKLGIVYMNSHFRNYEKAFHWFCIAAERDCAEAHYWMSRFYELNLLDKYDLEKAYQCLLRAMEQNEPQAMFRLSFWYRMGIYVPKDKKYALDLLFQLAEMGYVEALCQLGKEYESGGLVEQDAEKSWKYYRKAAESHHPYALYRLGKHYWDKHLIPGNTQIAVKYLEESSNKKCREAQYLLANICGTYFHHHVYDRYHWLQAAAKNGHPEAMYDLGCLYLFGNSFLATDYKKACYWFGMANKCGVRKDAAKESSLLADFGSGRFHDYVSACEDIGKIISEKGTAE